MWSRVRGADPNAPSPEPSKAPGADAPGALNRERGGRLTVLLLARETAADRSRQTRQTRAEQDHRTGLWNRRGHVGRRE
jgi:hypothetical protein